jgi:hypothetical protein
MSPDASSPSSTTSGGTSTIVVDASDMTDTTAPSPTLSDAGVAPDTRSPDAELSDTAVADAAPDGTGGAGDGIPYDQDGPVTYTMTSVLVTNGLSSFTEYLYVPSTPGPHPVVNFAPGLQQPAAAYKSYATRLASYGIVVLTRDDPGILAASSGVASDIEYVVGTWLPAQGTTASSALFGKVDTTHVGLAGHSRGGEATLLAAEGTLLGKVNAWFGIDPVDSSVDDTVQASTNLGSIGIPTTYLGAGVSTSCCPAGDNYQGPLPREPVPLRRHHGAQRLPHAVRRSGFVRVVFHLHAVWHRRQPGRSRLLRPLPDGVLRP